MNRLVKAYKLLNILSIDVALGAVVSALFFARIFEVTIRPHGIAVLALTVWIVYSVDHLKDAKQIKGAATSARHSFHQQYFKPLFVVLVAVVLIDFVLLFFVRKQVFMWGLRLAFCVLIYLIIHQKLPFLKELFVAVMYTFGVLLPSLAVTNIEMGFYHQLVVFQFFLVALLNLLIYSWYDADADSKDRLKSFVTFFGTSQLKNLIVALGITGILLFLIQLYFFHFDGAQVVLLMMMLTLLLVFHFNKRFRENDLYRIVGDAVFFFPVILLV